LQFEEVLGFVTTLRVEKSCKVVLVFNDEKMEERLEVYKRYREKVVDIEVLFEPTVAEAADLAIPEAFPYGALIREKLGVLGVRNIRLIQKVLANTILMQPLLADVHPDIHRNVISMTVLLTWLEYEPDEEHPSLEFVSKWNNLAFLIDEEKLNKPNAEDDPVRVRNKKWSDMLQNYGITSFDSCDEAIARVIKQGYVDGSGLDAEIARMTQEIDATVAEDRFTQGWRLYHDTLDDNEAEIAEIFDCTFDAAAPRISPRNLDSTVRLLRDMDRGKLAGSLIDRYLRIRGREAELFDPDEMAYGGSLEDEEVKKRFNDQFAQVHEAPSLDQTLKSMARNRGWSQKQVSVLTTATAEDFYQEFKQAGKGFDSMVKACLRFDNDPQRKRIATNAIVALKRIALESKVNRLRISRKFGISPDSLSSAP